MRYMLLLHHPEELRPAPGSPELVADMAEWQAFHEELVTEGIAFEGAPLQTVATATTVRRGELVTDGPFAELKEQLGGYYVVDLPDIDAAIALAKRVPWMADGAVEIRPVAESLVPQA